MSRLQGWKARIGARKDGIPRYDMYDTKVPYEYDASCRLPTNDYIIIEVWVGLG